MPPATHPPSAASRRAATNAPPNLQSPISNLPKPSPRGFCPTSTAPKNRPSSDNKWLWDATRYQKPHGRISPPSADNWPGRPLVGQIAPRRPQAHLNPATAWTTQTPIHAHSGTPSRTPWLRSKRSEVRVLSGMPTNCQTTKRRPGFSDYTGRRAFGILAPDNSCRTTKPIDRMEEHNHGLAKSR